MKKWRVPLIIFFILFLTACSERESIKKLTRVDVFQTGEDETIIAEKETVDTLEQVFDEIEWEENVKAEMSRKEDLKVVLFFEMDENMPESLVEYYLWFGENGATTFIDREKHSLGRLDEANTEVLKKELYEY